MPSKKTYSRRPRRRARRNYRRRPTIAKNPFPTTGPRKLPLTLTYSDRFTLDAGAGGTAAVKIFSANGVYDPDVSGIGHQPRGFDQYFTMYDHCTVVGAKVTFRFGGNSGDTYDQLVGITTKDSVLSSTNPIDYMESRYTKFVQLAGGQYINTKTLQMSVNPNKFLGVSKPLSEDTIKNSVGSNPSEGVFFHLWCAAVETVDPTYITCTVTIDYKVVFTEPKLPTIS